MPLRFLAAALGLLCVEVAAGDAGAHLAKLMQKGRDAANSGKMGAAAKIFRKALSLAPADVDVARAYGTVLFKGGAFHSAAKILGVAMELEPTDRTTRKALADAFAADGDLSTSLWHFGKVPVTRSMTLPPLNSALARDWRTPPRNLLLESQSLPAGSPTLPAHIADLGPRAAPALRKLRGFLSAGVVGEAYHFEFNSASMPLVDFDGRESRNLLEQAIRQLRALLPPADRAAARCAEWWTHRRPPKPPPPKTRRICLEGHPIHWDDDGDEANRTKPLYTSLLYLAENKDSPIASPTVVLNTTKEEKGWFIGDPTWVIHGQFGRVAMMPGIMLHGVLPSAGAIEYDHTGGAAEGPLRISLNVAWWPHDCRKPTAQADRKADPPEADAAWEEAISGGARPALMVPQSTTNVFCGQDRCGRDASGRKREEL